MPTGSANFSVLRSALAKKWILQRRRCRRPESRGGRMPSKDCPDLVIRDGEVVDGTGRERFRADVAIDADRIVAVGDLGELQGAREIDAEDRIVAPGFVDTHTHDACALLTMPDMPAKTSQGVTSLIAGNCGVS